MAKNASGGETDLLAKAMRQVFKEAVTEGVQPVKDAVDGLKQDVAGVKRDITTTIRR